MDLLGELIELDDSLDEINEHFHRQRWTDGLPIIPPTPARVERMLSRTRGEPNEVIAELGPKWGVATLANIAANAVMAGCLPEHLPVVVAAVEAMADPELNIYSLNATTHPVAPLCIVNGPIRQQIGMNAGSGLYGPGNRANAAIGRALRLILMNIAGAWPGETDMATQGSPAKYTYCIAENEEESPWEPLHVERGFQPDDSVVTIVAGEAPHNVHDPYSTDARGVLLSIAGTMTPLGANTSYRQGMSEITIVICPEHAANIAREGLGRRDVRMFLYERARVSIAELDRVGKWNTRVRPPWMFLVRPEDETVPVVAHPDALVICVGGGPGKHSTVIPSPAMGRAVSRRIDRALA
jgi:hypothetical protein